MIYVEGILLDHFYDEKTKEDRFLIYCGNADSTQVVVRPRSGVHRNILKDIIELAKSTDKSVVKFPVIFDERGCQYDDRDEPIELTQDGNRLHCQLDFQNIFK